MRGTKIMVLQMKDLIRVGAIVVAGLVLVVLALVLLLGRGGDRPQEHGAEGIFIPGVYSSTIILNDKPVEVRVTVSEDEILNVYMTDMAEIQRVFFPLFEPRMYDLATEVLRNQTVSFYPSTDYPVTTGILQRAVEAALEMAAAAN